MKKSGPSFIVLMVLCTFTLSAGEVINTEDHPESKVSMTDLVADHAASRKEIHQLQKSENRLNQIETRLKKYFTKKSHGRHHRDNIFSDPVRKWFWFWIIGWGFGILLTFLSGASLTGGIVGILWLLAFVGGSVALVIWLVKRFG